MRLKVVLAAIAILTSLVPCTMSAAGAKVLQGNIQQDDYLHRLNRPADNGGAPLQGGASSTRIQRPVSSGGLSGGTGMVDTAAFAPLTGSAGANGPLRSGLVDSGAFSAPPKNFDLGAESGSKELMLAWERWHKQLSSIIYQRWSERADSPGKATVRVTVTRDRHLVATILNSDGGRSFDAGLMDSMQGLDGNPGLTFPSKSNRQKVSFEADYVAGRNVNPGYSWIKNDYEKVRQQY
jgi:hypothetical protein